MNLYQIYAKPKALIGYADQDLLPWNVYEKAQGGQRLTPIQLANIAQDPEWAYHYARYVIDGPWPRGETAIAADPFWAYMYARHVLRCRWPQGEAAMQQDPEVWSRYRGWLLKLRREGQSQ